MKFGYIVLIFFAIMVGCATPEDMPYPEVSDAEVQAASTREIMRPIKEVMQRAVGIAAEKGYEVTTINESLGVITAVNTSPIHFTNSAMRYDSAYQGAATKSVVTLRFESLTNSTRVTITEKRELINFAMGYLDVKNEKMVKFYNDWLNGVAGK